jgi:hypothetical protein
MYKMSVADLFDVTGKIKQQYLPHTVLAKGIVTLVAGAATVAIPGLETTDVVLLTLYNGSGVSEAVVAEISANSLGIISDDNTSTKDVAYVAMKA